MSRANWWAAAVGLWMVGFFGRDLVFPDHIGGMISGFAIAMMFFAGRLTDAPKTHKSPAKPKPDGA